MALAIFDDVGAIAIIALFYSSKMSTLAIVMMTACTIVLYCLNRNKFLNYDKILTNKSIGDDIIKFSKKFTEKKKKEINTLIYH